MKVPFFDLKRENDRYAKEIKYAIDSVVDSGWYILGAKKNAFENAFATFCGTKYCIGVASGLDAIRLILEGYKALDVFQNGDEIILPGNTFIATALAVSQAGLSPILVDCDVNTYNISPIDVQNKITSKTKAIIAVHLFGLVAPIDELQQICNAHNLLLIEDAAQAQGATSNQKYAGNMANAAAFSFYPTKNLGAMGDAGAITTNDSKLAEIVYSLSNYGSAKKYEHELKGINSRLDEVQAAVLGVKLQYLKDNNRRRQQIAEIYKDNITNELLLLPQSYLCDKHVFHQYVIRTPKRDSLQSFLAINNIQTQIHYPKSIHKQTAYKELSDLKLPNCEQLQNEILSLPMFPSLTENELQFIVEAINKFK